MSRDPKNPGASIERCPICAHSDRLTKLWNTEILRCSECSLAMVDRMPSLEELRAIYSTEYFSGASSYANYVGERRSLHANFKARIRTLLRYKPTGNLFEVGCAHGFFLELAREHWTVSGSDISAKAIRYARRELSLDVTVGDFESLPAEAKSYDVIVMWDTIEHLYDPVKAVQKSAAALNPGALLAVTTGDVDAFWPRLRRRRWRLLHPAHLYYFSRRSLTRLLEAHGLQVVHFSRPGNYRSLLQLATALSRGQAQTGWRHRLFKQFARLEFLNEIHVSINLYDIMFVIARKPY